MHHTKEQTVNVAPTDFTMSHDNHDDDFSTLGGRFHLRVCSIVQSIGSTVSAMLATPSRLQNWGSIIGCLNSIIHGDHAPHDPPVQVSFALLPVNMQPSTAAMCFDPHGPLPGNDSALIGNATQTLSTPACTLDTSLNSCFPSCQTPFLGFGLIGAHTHVPNAGPQISQNPSHTSPPNANCALHFCNLGSTSHSQSHTPSTVVHMLSPLPIPLSLTFMENQ